MSSDPILNCITETCCGRQQADKLFAKVMVRDGACSKGESTGIVAWVRDRFDLAPVGTLTAFKRWMGPTYQSFAVEMSSDGVCGEACAKKVEGWVLHRFDLAPAGSLTAFKNRIIDLAKGAPFKEGTDDQ